jgi:hypothetical protein
MPRSRHAHRPLGLWLCERPFDCVPPAPPCRSASSRALPVLHQRGDPCGGAKPVRPERNEARARGGLIEPCGGAARANKDVMLGAGLLAARATCQPRWIWANVKGRSHDASKRRGAAARRKSRACSMPAWRLQDIRAGPGDVGRCTRPSPPQLERRACGTALHRLASSSSCAAGTLERTWECRRYGCSVEPGLRQQLVRDSGAAANSCESLTQGVVPRTSPSRPSRFVPAAVVSSHTCSLPLRALTPAHQYRRDMACSGGKGERTTTR